jgi:predicted phage baseplate assembly protein
VSGDGSVRLDPRDPGALITEAQERLSLWCPELSGWGGSDPAGTLVELFAWMTGLAVDRLSRVPDKLHVELLDLLGLQLDEPVAARAGLRMRLSAPASEPVEIRAGTEAGTLRTTTQESIVFTVQDEFVILPLRPVAYVVQRAGAYSAIGTADGVAHPAGPDQLPFSRPPQTGDALYLGFDQSLARMLMSVSIEASTARGAGVRPEDPPLRWEASQGDGAWVEVEVLADLTGGFNYGSGTVELQCPPRSAIEPIAGRRLHWLRCRIADTTRVTGEPAVYSQPPEIYRITAAPVGALVEAEHSVLEIGELLGVSDGTPAQSFRTRFAPMLGLALDETLEVQAGAGDWERWERRESFAESEPGDRHYVVDLVGGLIRLGPELRDQAAASIQHGAIPPKGSTLRMSRYRHGGGRAGNVGPGRVNTLRSAIPGVASVSNPEATRGGVDQQTLDSLRARSALQIRTRDRAVTTEDFEYLAAEATPRVARARRQTDDRPGITLRILPRVDPADHRLSIAELQPDPGLLEEVGRYLDARKLVGTPVRLEPMRLRGVAVVVSLVTHPRADLGRIEEQVRLALYTYLNPVIGGSASGPGDGWPFGRSLNQGELYAIVYGFEDVETIEVLRLYEVDLATGDQAQTAAGRQIPLEADEVIASGEHIVRVRRREP